MNLRNTLIASFSTLCLTSIAAAQLTWQPLYFNNYAGSAYDRTVGNSYLGGSLHAHAYLQTTTGRGYEMGQIDADARGSAIVLSQSATVGEIYGLLRNTMQNSSQTRTGNFRVTVLGFNYVNQSFTNDSQFAQRTWTFNLFPRDVSLPIGVGPFTMTVSGNAGASLQVSANFFLPAATPSVTLAGTGRVYAQAHGEVTVGIPGVSVGAGCEGRVCDTTLTAWATANPRTGFSGIAQVSVTPITLSLYGVIDTFIHRWTTTLCSWSSASILRQLM